MFGTNEITGQKAFKDAPINSLLVTSIFYTLQGEGPFTGRPAVFVRLAKCNLACSFCDTAFDQGEWMTFEEIEQRTFHEMDSQVHGLGLLRQSDLILVVTGGEPTLQANLTGFLLHQSSKWAEIQVESNGLVERLLPLNTTLVVSPKCTEPARLLGGHYLKPLPAVLSRADCLKFVVDSNPLSPYHLPPDWARAWMREQEKPVYVSPMNCYQEGKPLQLMTRANAQPGDLAARTKGEAVSFWTPGLLDRTRNEANHQHAAELCLKYGFRLSLQTHLYVGLA
jgi:organic radical activating enzyme